MILDGYIEYQQQRKLLVTPVQNVSVHRVRKKQGVWCFALEGVTAEDPKYVRDDGLLQGHGHTYGIELEAIE